MRIRRTLSGAAAAALVMTLSVVIAPAALAATTTPGAFNSVTQTRVLDTRNGTGAPKMIVAPGATISFVATAGIVASVASVALNVTAVTPSLVGFLTVYPTGGTRPTASSLNFTAHLTVANMVISSVGSGGRVSIYNGSSGGVQIVADRYGYFAGGTNAGDGGTLVSMAPTRFLDTRIGLGAAKHRAAPLSVTKVQIGGAHGVPANAAGVLLNVTAVQPAGLGFVTVYPGDPRPVASSVNSVKGQNRANLVVSEVAADGSVSIYNGSASTVDLVADVSGYFVAGTPSTDGTEVSFTPYRVFDSRTTGVVPAAHSVTKVQIFPPNDPTFSLFKAVVVNVTASNSTAPGYLTVWTGGGPVPTVSIANFTPRGDFASAAIIPVADDGTISIFNGSAGSVSIVVDIDGFLVNVPANG